MPARKSRVTSSPTSRAKAAAVKPPAGKAATTKPKATAAAKPKATAAAKPKATPKATLKSVPKAAPPALRVSEQDSKKYETRLLEERGRLRKELGHLEQNVLKQNPRESSGDLSGYSFHMADAGTDAMEREKAFLFASTEGRALHDIDAALRRLYAGEYGACESCGVPIAPQRLEVVPHARLCIKCKEREEKAGRR